MAEKAPAAAKVAKPKKPSKQAAEKQAVAKDVAKRSSGSSAIKLPYNFRTRSLANTLLKAVEDEESRKEARKELKELRTFAEIKETSVRMFGKEAFEEVLEQWFDDGEAKD